MNETLKLAFLPWLTLQEPAVIGEVTFTPFSISEGDPASIFADFRDDIVRILSGYRGIFVPWTLLKEIVKKRLNC